LNVWELEPEDFTLLLSVGVLAPVTVESLAEASEEQPEAVTASLGRLKAAGLVDFVGGSTVLTGAGHENLSRRNFRRVRDVGRMLYLWRGSRGID
jgi:hypothetical protein